jgi:ABC-type spermidine/putrescine transport system permease subunit II
MFSGLHDQVDPTIAAVSSLLTGVTVVLLPADSVEKHLFATAAIPRLRRP